MCEKRYLGSTVYSLSLSLCFLLSLSSTDSITESRNFSTLYRSLCFFNGVRHHCNPRYQANRAFIIGRMKKMLPKILCGFSQLSAIDQVFEDALRCRSQVLPGRTFRRKKSHTKGRSHFNNKKIAF